MAESSGHDPYDPSKRDTHSKDSSSESVGFRPKRRCHAAVNRGAACAVVRPPDEDM